MNTKVTYKIEAKNCTIGFARFEDGQKYFLVYDHVLNLACRHLFDTIVAAEDHLKSYEGADLAESYSASPHILSPDQELVTVCMDLKHENNDNYQFISTASRSLKIITGDISDDGLGRAYTQDSADTIH